MVRSIPLISHFAILYKPAKRNKNKIKVLIHKKMAK